MASEHEIVYVNILTLDLQFAWRMIHTDTHSPWNWPTQQCPSNHWASCQANEVAWQCVSVVTFSAFVNKVRAERKGGFGRNRATAWHSILRELIIYDL